MTTVSAASSHDAAVANMDDSSMPGLDLTSSPPDIQVLGNAAKQITQSVPPQTRIDPKDPEGYLKRCSGSNKRGERCSAIIGKKNDTHPAYLPTCHAHKDQRRNAGWCQFPRPDGGRCGRLFAWTPPYFEMCSEHIGHPDTPCYLLKLPLEIRLEIFRYLMPEGPIDSAGLHNSPFTFTPVRFPRYSGLQSPPLAPIPPSIPPRHLDPRRLTFGQLPLRAPEAFSSCSVFNLFLTNRQIYAEAKNFLYSTIPFTIDIRKDGTFMCGRRLLEPRRADGLPHCAVDGSEAVAKKFVANFDFAAVKNYNVDILVENGACDANNPASFTFHGSYWDEEVEIYDIRDYVGVAVSGILSKAKNLCRLNVRVGLSKFRWSEETLLVNTKRIIGPFERLRNIVQPKFLGVFDGSSQSTHIGFHQVVVPRLAAHTYLLGPGSPQFDKFKADWEKWLSQSATASPKKPPIRAMFTEFKSFYSKLQTMVPDVHRSGRHAFLHRARVARESEDVDAFRELRNELILYWNMYLEREEARQADMNKRLSRMLDTDTYPSPDDFTPPPSASSSSSTSSLGTASAGWNQSQYPASEKGHLPDPATNRLAYMQQHSPARYQHALPQLESQSIARLVSTQQAEKQPRAQKPTILTQRHQQYGTFNGCRAPGQSSSAHPPGWSYQITPCPPTSIASVDSSSSSKLSCLPHTSEITSSHNPVTIKTEEEETLTKSPKFENSTPIPSHLVDFYEQLLQQLTAISPDQTPPELHFITMAEAESRSHEQINMSPIQYLLDGPKLGGGLNVPHPGLDICLSVIGLHYFRKRGWAPMTRDSQMSPISSFNNEGSTNNPTCSSLSSSSSRHFLPGAPDNHSPGDKSSATSSNLVQNPYFKPTPSPVNTKAIAKPPSRKRRCRIMTPPNPSGSTTIPDSPPTPMQTTAWPMNPLPPCLQANVIEEFDFDSFLHIDGEDTSSMFDNGLRVVCSGNVGAGGDMQGKGKGKQKVGVGEVE